MSLNVLVTGGTGFLGRRLVHSLLETDATIHCLVRPTSDTRSVTDGLAEVQQARIHFVTADLKETAALAEHLSGIDVVYHLAASLAGSCSTMFLNTVIPTRQLVTASAISGVKRFVLVSSLGVYGTQSLRRGGTLDETVPVDPHPERRDPYTFSKIRQEQAAREEADRLGLSLVIVRPGVIYGPGRSLLTSRVGLTVGSLLLRMGGGHRLPYTYVENCAQAICLAGTTPGVDGEIFNVIDDETPTGRQLDRLARQHRHIRHSLWIPQCAVTPLWALYAWYARKSEGQLPEVLNAYRSQALWKPLRYSNEKVRRRLNWRPRVSTEMGLSATITG